MTINLMAMFFSFIGVLTMSPTIFPGSSVLSTQKKAFNERQAG
jgi:hypothetical protein